MKKTLFLAALCAAFVGFVGCSVNVPEDEKPNNGNENPPVEVESGELNGKFSVSESAQVIFSKGNLQYVASTKTWQFAKNQYDVVGEANTKIADDNTTAIDLFGWGTGTNPTLNSEKAVDYAKFAEWGKNDIRNGGNAAGLWRTLTKDEWNYLLNNRVHATSLYALATVNRVTGLILLPDTWSLPDNAKAIHTGNSSKFEENVFTVEEWKVYEIAGAVFLPVAGMRGGVQFTDKNGGGYWSSTSGDESKEANVLHISSKNTLNLVDQSRHYGFSVRLVK